MVIETSSTKDVVIILHYVPYKLNVPSRFPATDYDASFNNKAYYWRQEIVSMQQTTIIIIVFLMNVTANV